MLSRLKKQAVDKTTCKCYDLDNKKKVRPVNGHPRFNCFEVIAALWGKGRRLLLFIVAVKYYYFDNCYNKSCEGYKVRNSPLHYYHPSLLTERVHYYRSPLLNHWDCQGSKRGWPLSLHLHGRSITFSPDIVKDKFSVRVHIREWLLHLFDVCQCRRHYIIAEQEGAEEADCPCRLCRHHITARARRSG